ncbi:MAG: lactoylglutathione lyase, partial [Rhodospirillales bacterium]|nr:lactoylglutathione lyase [Rhodospirillales bacterium]
MTVASAEKSTLAGEAGTTFRFLHTMIRVKDLEKSLAFYAGALGMKILRRKDYPDGKFTLAFVGYGDEANTAVIELTHNWGREEGYEVGTGFGHLALAAKDVYATCDRLAKAGVKITRLPGPMKHGGSVIAFIEDPDGYKIELIERGEIVQPASERTSQRASANAAASI